MDAGADGSRENQSGIGRRMRYDYIYDTSKIPLWLAD